MAEEVMESGATETEGQTGEGKERKGYRKTETSRGSTDTRGAFKESSNGFRQRRTYFRKKVCKLCLRKAKSVDYKDVDLLRKFVTDRGKILPRRITGTCARHQRMLSRAIKRARMVAFLPFVSK